MPSSPPDGMSSEEWRSVCHVYWRKGRCWRGPRCRKHHVQAFQRGASAETISASTTNVDVRRTDTETLSSSREQVTTVLHSSDRISGMDTMPRRRKRMTAEASSDTYACSSQSEDVCSVCLAHRSAMMGFVHTDHIHIRICQDCYNQMDGHSVNPQGQILKKCPLCRSAVVAMAAYRA